MSRMSRTWAFTSSTASSIRLLDSCLHMKKEVQVSLLEAEKTSGQLPMFTIILLIARYWGKPS